ncbi:MAG: hypothetical protein N3C60_03550 [Calditerrivibrio sp.]|nr:hypothetical protein [Calditerrivibrio sp.]
MFDRELFRWLYLENDRSDIYSPVVWNGYQLNYFDYAGESFIIKDDYKPIDALYFSINFYKKGELNLIHLSNLACIVQKLGVLFSDIDLFKKYGIKSSFDFELLLYFNKLPDKLKKYLSEKEVSLKYIKQIRSLSHDTLIHLVNFVERFPSLGEFRGFLNDLFDFGGVIGGDLGQLKLIKRKRDEEYYTFLESFNKILMGFKHVQVRNSNNFEKSELIISFSISNIDDLYKALDELTYNTDNFKKLFSLMEDYGIS